MRRVLVLGCSGSGKSTFARALGARARLPVVHLDQLYWRPGWVPAPRAEFEAAVAEAAAGERWVMDGNNASTFGLRVPRADAIVWFRRSRALCLWRVARRVAGSYGRVRPDMAPGCPERLDLEFLRYIWTFEALQVPKIEAGLVRHGGAGRVTMIRSDGEADAFLAAVEVS
jgi:adenylate kinase family enzyme